MTVTRPLIVTRPDPGGTATLARARAMGLDAHHLPLFAARPLDWTPPDPAGFDALLLTSAQAVRLAGAGLARLAVLPVHAVGAATARAAEAAGLTVAAVGDGDVQSLADGMASRKIERILWLCGRDRTAFDFGAATVCALPCYAVDAVEPPPEWDARIASDAVLLAHSRRAASRIADLTEGRRAALAIVAISPAARGAAGDGWGAIVAAPQPTDAAMLAVARTLCHKGAK